NRQKVPQTLVQRFGGIHETVIQTGRPRLFGKQTHMLVDLHLVLVARVIRRDFHGGIVFHILQQDGVAKLRREFVRIQNMEQHHFVAAVPQGLDYLDDLLRLLIEVGHYDNDAAPLEKLLEVDEGLGKIRARAPFRLLDGVQDTHQLALPGGWRDVIGHVLIEDDQSRGIPLLRRHVGERSGEVARIIQFSDAARSISHGLAGVEQDEQLHVRLALEALQIKALRAGENVPIDVAEIVSLNVLLILGELLAEAELRRAVQPRDTAIHHRLRDKVERRYGRQYRGIE